MNREEIMNSIALKKRFCKDCNLPITVYDNPYFYERLSTIDIFFDCISKFDNFCYELQKFSNEQEYFEYYNQVKDGMISYIQSRSSYEDFNKNTSIIGLVMSLDSYAYPKKNLYVEPNNGCTFISIDMKKANFSALNHYAKDIFECDEWEDFVGRFTENKHIIQSKYIRQVVLGACNPKKQIQYERYLMAILLKHLMSQFPELNLFSLGEDEILIVVDKGYGFSLKELRKAVANCPEGIGNLVKIEMFDLHKIPGTDGWMKVVYSFSSSPDKGDNVKFKCLEADIYHQVVKHYLNQPITENDLVFYYNGKLAKFLKEIDNPWKN